ncbi:unnamed protein product [Arctogadus glacialis]
MSAEASGHVVNEKPCEWDDEDGNHGYIQYGYDGEGITVSDLKTLTWIVPTRLMAEIRIDFIMNTAQSTTRQWSVFVGRGSTWLICREQVLTTALRTLKN